MRKGSCGKKALRLGRRTLKKLAVICLGGLAAGFCNGLLGAGGGIVAVLALSAVLPKDEESRRSLYANALCIMLPLSVLTLVTYALRTSIPPDFLGNGYVGILIGGAIGGVLGGLVLGKLRSEITDKLFAVLTVLSGILMIV